MKLAKQLLAAVITLAALSTAQVHAIDSVNAINVTVKIAGNSLQSGTVNVVTARARVTLQYIGTMAFNIPGDLFMGLSGFTTEKAGTILVLGEEVGGATFSVVGDLAGEGTVNDGMADQLIVVQGSIRLGPPKLVPSAQ